MKQIQELFDQKVITSFSMGHSALPDRNFFCNLRSRELEGNVQGHGETAQEAFDQAMLQMHQSIGHLHHRPVTTTVQMPETPTLRMPF